MRPSARFATAVDIISAWQENPDLPFADQLQVYLRTRRFIGSSDRRAITHWCYQMLRCAAAAVWALGGAHPRHCPRPTFAILAAAFSTSLEEILPLLDGSPYSLPVPDADLTTLLESAWEGRDTMPIAARLNCPEWAWPLLQDEPLLAAMNTPAPATFRVNTLRNTRELVLHQLAEEGIHVTSSPLSPWGILAANGGGLRGHALLQDGSLEPQDCSSQLAALCTEALPHMRVLDYCAGAGGKALAMATMMQNKGIIDVYDSDPTRLTRIAPRAARAGVKNIHIPEALEKNSYDVVLIDAPCSGSGTWRRQPDARWRYTHDDLILFAALQQKLLEEASVYVKQGGVLIYATCSLFAAENEVVADAFTAAHPAFIHDAPKDFPIPFTPYGVLSPHVHGSDGFFLARWRREMGD